MDPRVVIVIGDLHSLPEIALRVIGLDEQRAPVADRNEFVSGNHLALLRGPVALVVAPTQKYCEPMTNSVTAIEYVMQLETLKVRYAQQCAAHAPTLTDARDSRRFPFVWWCE